MKSIFKYKIDINSEKFGVSGPITKFLSVQVQRSQVCIWAEIDTDIPDRHFAVFPIGTGWDTGLIPIFQKATFLDTVQLYGGDLVWHIYYVELTEPYDKFEGEWE